MRGVSFVWKKPADSIDKIEVSDIGFIAQEIERTIPELVFSEDKETHLKKVKYYEIITLCIEAIKEQDVELAESENRLEYLENRIKEKGLI
jgi:putative sterol carrier protein